MKTIKVACLRVQNFQHPQIMTIPKEKAALTTLTLGVVSGELKYSIMRKTKFRVASTSVG
jgi:hypothetical protein